jgi:hypothetical protein
MKKDVDVDALRRLFVDTKSHGVVALIDYLASPQGAGVIEIGSSTIGLTEVIRDIETGESTDVSDALARLGSLYIGSCDGSVTPLMWLQDISKVYALLPAKTKEGFDRMCHSFAAMAQAKLVGSIEIFTGGVIYRVPAEAYRDDMTAEEMGPYRVERSWLDEGLE